MDILTLTRKKRFYLILILFIGIITQPALSQTKAKITNVDFRLEGNRYIIVNYNLTGTLPREEMTIELQFINENNEKIVPKSVINDIGKKVYEDGQKAIVWDFVSDLVNTTGNWKAIVAITSSKILFSGPGNAFLNILIPGLGGYYVDQKKGRAVLSTLSTLGLVAYGVVERMQADKFYNDYNESTTPSEMDGLYTQANDANHKYYMATRAAAGIWALDFIYVTIKGFHNKKVAKNAYNAYTGDGFTLKHANNGFQVGYSVTF
ncbi:MAG: hypothetical protein NTW82_09835 [Bacteroidia bacterium]|nr:hypothetical protein [Bacteroidia bacterium]